LPLQASGRAFILTISLTHWQYTFSTSSVI
jgi:hypothetical protein